MNFQIMRSERNLQASATQTPSTPTELPSAHSQLLSATTSSSSQTVTSLLVRTVNRKRLIKNSLYKWQTGLVSKF